MKLNIERYPPTINRSLQAFSSADSLILSYIDEHELAHVKKQIYNDRFGFLTCHLQSESTVSITQWKSQEISIRLNLERNNITACNLQRLLESSGKDIELAIVRVPKSMDLFRLYLHRICGQLKSSGQVICGFMTKYFTKQMLSIAEEYFDTVIQSKAHKKARLLILSDPRAITTERLMKFVEFESDRFGQKIYQQYLGVFSSSHIDYATQFLLKEIPNYTKISKIMDLASGNGVIGDCLSMLYPNAEIHYVDDSILAIESSRLNVNPSANSKLHYTNELSSFDFSEFDLIVTNPPFHLGHENNIEVSISLFEQAHEILKFNGKLVIVANKHLNYKTHLIRYFKTVLMIGENKSFILYECTK